MEEEKMYNSQEVARFMVSYVQSRLPRQMVARGERPSPHLCELVNAKYEQEVPLDIRLAVDDLEQAMEDRE